MIWKKKMKNQKDRRKTKEKETNQTKHYKKKTNKHEEKDKTIMKRRVNELLDENFKR